MNKKNILNRYKKDKALKSRMLLKDGSVVVGEEVDENNMLYYVIKDGDNLTIDRANKHRPISNLLPEVIVNVEVSMDGKILKVDEIKEKL